METKTHYRKVYKSDHLGIADLEDFIEDKKSLIFTIKEVKQELGVSVAGKKGDFNIAYFVEPIKPLVLNATNASVIKSFANNSSFIEDWKNIPVELYIDPNVKMKGAIVGGVRIKLQKPVLPLLKLETKAYQNALAHLINGGKIEDIQVRFTVLEDVKLKLFADAHIK